MHIPSLFSLSLILFLLDHSIYKFQVACFEFSHVNNLLLVPLSYTVILNVTITFAGRKHGFKPNLQGGNMMQKCVSLRANL